MPNRFTDSEKFKNKWYRNLTPKHKCMWEYFTSECNIAGILEVDLEMMTFCIGEKIAISDFEIFKERVFFIKEDLVFIPSFVLFQQKINTLSELNYKNKAHKGIMAILSKYNIDDTFKGALKPLVRGTGIGIGIGIGIGNKEKKEFKKLGEFKNVFLTETHIEELKKIYKEKFDEAIGKLSSYIESSGKKYKNHYAVLGKHNWVYKAIFPEKTNITQEENEEENEYTFA